MKNVDACAMTAMLIVFHIVFQMSVTASGWWHVYTVDIVNILISLIKVIQKVSTKRKFPSAKEKFKRSAHGKNAHGSNLLC